MTGEQAGHQWLDMKGTAEEGAKAAKETAKAESAPSTSLSRRSVAPQVAVVACTGRCEYLDDACTLWD